MKRLLVIIPLLALAFAVLAVDLKVNLSYNGTTNDTAGFAIYYGPSSRNYTNVWRTGFVTNTVISGLPPNSTIFLSGRAVGFDNLESDLGNEVQVTTDGTSNSLPTVVKDFRLLK